MHVGILYIVVPRGLFVYTVFHPRPGAAGAAARLPGPLIPSLTPRRLALDYY